MFRCEVIADDGRVLKLDDSSGVTVYEIEGLNPVKAEINKTKNVGFNGVKISSAHIDERNLTIKMAILWDPETARQKLYDFLRPASNVRFRFVGDTKDVWIEGCVEDLDISFFSMYQTAQAVILCPEPFWKDTEEQMIEMKNVTPTFTFPITTDGPFVLGRYADITEVLAHNSGEVETGMKFIMTASGEVKNPIIFNKYTGEYIGINMTLNAGDVVEITTNVGNKKITLFRDSAQTNIFNFKRSGSVWLTLRRGDNVFLYDADSGKEFLSVKILYTPEYIGV